MRSLRWPVVAAFAGIVACNSVEQGIPGGGGGGGFGTDAGAATDAGAGGSGGEGTVDAGTTSGADAGGGGTGGGGNGNADAGTTVSDCAGVAPASLGTMASYSEGYDSSSGVCGAPVGNGAGIIAHFVASDRYPRFTLVNPSGGVNGRIATVAHGGVIPLPSGFLDWSFMQFRGTNEEQFMDAIDDSGRPRSAGRNFFFMYSPREQWFALDVNGGTALAGTIPVNNQKDQRRVMMFGATGSIRWGPRDLSTDSLVFGVGVDLKGRALVIQSGYGQCSGCILGQWFERDGTALTGSFTLIEGFTPGPATWFDTAPLIGGGLAVRRVDARASGQLRGFTSSWLLTLDSGSTSGRSAPAWMTSRNNTNLALARGGRAYAVLANGGDGERCTQKLEVVSPSGNSCGSFDLAMTNDGSTCDNWDLGLGLDGTVVQHLPAQLEQALDSSGRTRSCTIRFWPAALK